MNETMRITLKVMSRYGYDENGQWHQPDMRPRRISPDARHAMDKLDHAIDYLAWDLYASSEYNVDMMETINQLMAANREVYFSCPVVREHPLNAACGIVNGCIIGLAMWALIIWAVVHFAQKWGLPW